MLCPDALPSPLWVLGTGTGVGKTQVAARLARRPARGSYTFGLRRVEILAAHGEAISRDYAAYTAATAVVETCDRLTEEHLPATQQYLLVAGALALRQVAHSATP